MILHTLLGLSIAGSAISELTARAGQKVHCVGERAHLLQYDIEGEPNDGSSLKGVQQAIVAMMPSLAHSAQCLRAGDHTPEGDKQFCYGVNQDSSCKVARSNIPIKDGIDCKDCFVSASADAYYKLNYTVSHLNTVEVGLRDINLRASVGIHKHLSASSTPASGNFPFPGSDKELTVIDELVGCPVCVKVKITIAFPTSLDYTMSLSGGGDLEAGASLDINLGDNVVKYDGNAAGNKWSHEEGSPKVSVTPILSADAKALADLKLDVKTSAQVNVDSIVWYHLDMAPAFDTKVTFEGHNLLHKDQVCLNGDAAFTMSQEADLDWNLLKWHAKGHWGPHQLFDWSKTGIVHGCKDINIENSTAMIV